MSHLKKTTSYSMGAAGPCPRLNWPKREANHLPLCSVNIRKEWRAMTVLHLHDLHKDNCTFYFCINYSPEEQSFTAYITAAILNQILCPECVYNNAASRYNTAVKALSFYWHLIWVYMCAYGMHTLWRYWKKANFTLEQVQRGLEVIAVHFL